MSQAAHTVSSPMPSSHAFHSSILREYDIRGIVGDTLHPADAYFIGRGFASHLAEALGRAPVLAVARDGRLSSPELADALADGMVDAGATVRDAGLGPTPMLYFAVNHLEADGGIMVTGSHNPPTHNGFKMMQGKLSFFGADIRDLGKRVADGKLAQGDGSREAVDVREAYLEALLMGYQGEGRPLKAAWDPGNGATGEMVERLCAQADVPQVLMNTEIDGTFPNHHPDPSVPENLEQVKEALLAQGCDVGLAFDGDGDRLGVVDDKGRVLSSDHLLMLFARDVLAAKPGGTIIADVKTSQTVFDDVRHHGGQPLMWKTGHSHIKSKMKEIGSPFAGEASGHIFFADRYYGFDDGIYAAVRLLNILARQDKPLSALVDELAVMHSTPEIRIDCAEERKFVVIEEVRARLEQAKADFVSIDGVRVNMPQGWWLLRASNTQAAIIGRCEAASEANLAVLVESLRDQLQQSGVELVL